LTISIDRTDGLLADDSSCGTDELAAARVKIENLELALATSRTIGMAVGIVMERLRVPPNEAFDVLRALSQRQHRKLRDIAAELTFCGTVTGLDSCGQEGGSPVPE
jgi:hypothetical protein